MSDEPTMTFRRNFHSDVCSCCGNLIPHVDLRLGITAPDKPMLMICSSCVHEIAGRLVAQIKAERPAATEATQKKKGKTK